MLSSIVYSGVHRRRSAAFASRMNLRDAAHSSPTPSRASRSSSNLFRMNTCKSVSKQMTLTPRRMNTYEKHRGVGVLLLTRHPTESTGHDSSASLPRHLVSAIFLIARGEFAMSVNRVMLVGRLGRDPETRYTSGGQAVANFSVATDESYKDRNGERQKRTEWHKIVVWGKQAEIAQQYLKKGSLVFIEGRIQSREWQDKEGQKRTSFEIVANNFRMLGWRSDAAAAAGATAGGAGGGAPRGGEDVEAGGHVGEFGGGSAGGGAAGNFEEGISGLPALSNMTFPSLIFVN